MKLQLIPDWRNAWRFWSMWLVAAIALLAALEPLLPQLKAVLPERWYGVAVLLIGVARIVQQRIPNRPDSIPASPTTTSQEASTMKLSVTRITSAFFATVAVLFLSSMALATSLTDDYEAKILNHTFRGTAYTAPATTYIRLNTTSCSDSAGGTEVSTSGTAYARSSITSNTSNWSAPGTNGTITNSNAVPFNVPTANWGTVSHFEIMDASTSGNALTCAALTTPRTIANGDGAPSFAPGAIAIQIDN